MADTRIESDTFGPIEVPADRYWGAQTERSRRNFRIGTELMPLPVINALTLVKRIAAEVNCGLGLLDEPRKQAIVAAADEILAGRLAGNFPLVVWQTGSGTQSNMNVNEVIANRGNELMGSTRGANAPLHPNDHVNMSQSSNDCFPTAIRIAAVREIDDLLIPALAHLRDGLADRQAAFDPIVKIGPAGARARPHPRSGDAPLPGGPRRHRGRHGAQCAAAVRRTLRGAARGGDRAALPQRIQQVRGAGGP
jgi:fumarate hydratase class II